jgi:pyruvate, water dikinase
VTFRLSWSSQLRAFTPWVRRLGLCSLFVGSGSCAASADGANAVREFHLLKKDGAPLSEFRVTAVFADGVEGMTCQRAQRVSDEPAPHLLACTADGFRSLGAESPRQVTVRSRGSTFATVEIEEHASASVTVRLAPLRTSEVTEDYASRLDGEDCLEQLGALALLSDSELGESASVKFYIGDLDSDEPHLYFQNTPQHPLHYDFAREVLGVTGTADAFAEATYTGNQRTALAGTLVWYPAAKGTASGTQESVSAPWTLNFAPFDTIAIEQVLVAHRLVEERLTCLDWQGPTRRLAYVPASSERESEALQQEEAFVRRGVPWLTRADLLGGLSVQPLNAGIAYGRLRRMTPEELERQVVSYRDILLLPRIPNELPLVGGTISYELQTPLAHVNVAARSRGTPNLAYPGAGSDEHITSLLDELVRFEVSGAGFTLQAATLEEAQAFWDRRVPERMVPTYDSEKGGIASFATIGFKDWQRVGSKAANLAELTHALGERAPSKGLALPFYYYEAFMAEAHSTPELCADAERACLSSQRAVPACQRARVSCAPEGANESLTAWLSRLLADTEFQSDTAVREAALANVRYVSEQSPLDVDFAGELDERIFEEFGEAKVKLRSSTNTEDLPNFSGAGLYSSYAAYARGEKAASKQLVKVFASTWSFRAFEERSFWNIDHLAVRMGCAINEAFVDELANGVLITQNIADPNVFGMYVNVQLGEAEVTNPVSGQLPEVFSILGDTNYDVVRSRYSSLSPGAALLSRHEIRQLYDAGAAAQEHFSKLYGHSTVLDIEFKLTSNQGIVFKQARPYVAR